MTFGDKNDFAIEYSFADKYPKEMGYGRIWIGNEFIGTYKNLIYLSGYLLGTVYEFKRAKELMDNLRFLTKEQLFDLFASGKYNDSDNYLVRGSTFTDDFSIWTYKIDNHTYILWKVLRTDFFEDLNNYKQEVFLKSVRTDRLTDVISKVEIEFRNIGILKAN